MFGAMFGAVFGAMFGPTSSSTCARGALWGLGVACLAGCGGVAPDPDAIAAELPPARTLTAGESLRIERLQNELDVLVATKLVDEADEKAREILAIDPRHAPATAVVGWCWMQMARRSAPPRLALWRRAEGELRKAQRLAPGDPAVALLHAEFLEADGHLAAAAAVLDAAVRAHPRHQGALRGLARLRYELGEERLAIPAYQALLAEDPADAGATFRLAHALARVAAGEAVTRTFDPAAADRPYARAGLLQAAATFQTYRTLEPRDVEGLLGEAQARLRAATLDEKAIDRAQLELARDLYRQAQELEPASAHPLFGSALVAEQEADPERAIALYQAALAKDPQHVGARLNLITLLAGRGALVEARAHAQAALQQRLSPIERSRLERWLAGKDAAGESRPSGSQPESQPESRVGPTDSRQSESRPDGPGR